MEEATDPPTVHLGQLVQMWGDFMAQHKESKPETLWDIDKGLHIGGMER